jgi:photosystem II stability/assembly factor-like uncharacterized protein
VAGLKQSWRVFWFGIAFIVFAVLTYLAFFHARLGSVSRPSFFSIGWWLQPIEFNAPGRINHVESGVNFTCISALAGGRELWVGGSKGVIIHTTDGGKTWEQLSTVTASAESSATKNQPTPTPTPQSKSKAFYLKPSDLRSRRIAGANSEREEWIHVGLPESTPVRPDMRQQQIVPNAANQAAPKPNAGKNLPIDKTPPNAADQPAPTLSPSRTEQGVTQAPATKSTFDFDSFNEEWKSRQKLVSNDIVDLSFVTPMVGYALTGECNLVVTRDGGHSWRLLNFLRAGIPCSAYHIKFIDDKRGVSVGSYGISYTLDGGGEWSMPIPLGISVQDIVLTNGLNGVAVQSNSNKVIEFTQTTEGGSYDDSPGRISLGEGGPPLDGGLYVKSYGPLLRITKNDSKSFFVCGVNGVVARNDSTMKWQRLETRVTANLAGIFFASDRSGWSVGSDGTIIATRDRGDHWEKQASGINWKLSAVYFSSESRGFAAGDDGTLIGTDDGGRHWQPVVLAGSGGAGSYGWLPAPWYFVSLLLLFGFVRKIPEEIVPSTKQGIAELLASDKPIGPEDPDYLGFRQVALGLSNYLRNNATKPPLTVAVTGEWGMGKSSLMNLVQGDLRSYKFRPVWFNAWHHQTEESLLAALLGNVRTQAIPSIFTPEGIVFRVKLLWLRARRNLFVFLLVVAAISFCISYFAADPHRLTQPPEALTKLLSSPSEAIMKLAGRHEEVGKAVLVLASAIAALITFLKGFRAFGADPSSLLASKSNAAKAKDLRAQTSFRYRFENQFREVTDSLNPLTMVLFVDDLDRCRPEEVYDMLEAINFLVSCGDCFVIMGLARRRVERCVGLVFEKVAAEGPDVIDHKKLSRQEKRERFAQMYLEKLINIEVPVPKGGLEQIRTLLTSKKEEPPPRSRVEIVGERLSDLVPHLIPASLAAVAAMIAVWCSLQLFAPGDSSLRNARVASETAAPQTQTAAQRQGSANVAEASPTPSGSPAGIGSAKFFPGQSGKTPLWAILLVATGILTPGIIRLSRRTGSVIEDSPAFIDALDKWFPFLVTGREMTPRAIKRFVNRVRYFAMMEGSFRPARRWWERLAQFLESKKETAPQAPPTGTREDLLVALATIHERHSEWFTGDRESFVATFLESIHGARATEKGSLLEFEHLIVEVDQPTYEHFKKLVAGVEVR